MAAIKSVFIRRSGPLVWSRTFSPDPVSVRMLPSVTVVRPAGRPLTTRKVGFVAHFSQRSNFYMQTKYTISGGPEQGVEQRRDDGLAALVVSWIGRRRWLATSEEARFAGPRVS